MVYFKSVLLLAAASVFSTAASSSLRRSNQAEDVKIWLSVNEAAGSTPSVQVGSGTEIIIISANGGGGAPTQQYNQMAMPAKNVHNVTVGGSAGLVYTPSTISAAVGDIVQFWFESKNHTVTQSSFATPCEKIVGGMDSGFMPNPDNTMNPPPMLQFQVTTSAPIWMYCAQKGHCGMGMVFSINPTSTKTHAAFQAAAIAQNGTAASAGAAAAAASSVVAAPPSASSSSSALAGSSGSSGSSESSSTTMAMGSGTLTSGGTCNCACLCGAGQFPAGAGVGMYGGMGGSMPMASAIAAPSAMAMPMPAASNMAMSAGASMASGAASSPEISQVAAAAANVSGSPNMPMASSMPAGSYRKRSLVRAA